MLVLHTFFFYCWYIHWYLIKPLSLPLGQTWFNLINHDAIRFIIVYNCIFVFTSLLLRLFLINCLINFKIVHLQQMFCYRKLDAMEAVQSLSTGELSAPLLSLKIGCSSSANHSQDRLQFVGWQPITAKITYFLAASSENGRAIFRAAFVLTSAQQKLVQISSTINNEH